MERAQVDMNEWGVRLVQGVSSSMNQSDRHPNRCLLLQSRCFHGFAGITDRAFIDRLTSEMRMAQREPVGASSCLGDHAIAPLSRA